MVISKTCVFLEPPDKRRGVSSHFFKMLLIFTAESDTPP